MLAKTIFSFLPGGNGKRRTTKKVEKDSANRMPFTSASFFTTCGRGWSKVYVTPNISTPIQTNTGSVNGVLNEPRGLCMKLGINTKKSNPDVRMVSKRKVKPPTSGQSWQNCRTTSSASRPVKIGWCSSASRYATS
ncbi:hypothetical protein KA005_06615, partial [bacterium]|nr:hypothetical protein [bacterium]